MRRQQGVTQLLRAVAPVASRPLVLSKVAKQARQAAVAAQAAATSSAPDHGGTVYPVNITNVTKYSNVDGGRIDDGRYTNFKADVGKLIPEERLYTDPVKTFAYGTDASFYRLLPQIVVKVHNEQEVKEILANGCEALHARHLPRRRYIPLRPSRDGLDPAEAQPHGQELPQLRDQGASRRSTIDVTRWIRPDEKTHPFTAAFSEPISRHPPVSSFAEAPRRTSRRTSRRRACASIERLTWDASRPAGRPSPSLALFPLPQTDPFPIRPTPRRRTAARSLSSPVSSSAK